MMRCEQQSNDDNNNNITKKAQQPLQQFIQLAGKNREESSKIDTVSSYHHNQLNTQTHSAQCVLI